MKNTDLFCHYNLITQIFNMLTKITPKPVIMAHLKRMLRDDSERDSSAIGLLRELIEPFHTHP